MPGGKMKAMRITEETLLPLGFVITLAGGLIWAVGFGVGLSKDRDTFQEGFKEVFQRMAVQDSTIKTNNEICAKNFDAVKSTLVDLQFELRLLRTQSTTAAAERKPLSQGE